MYLEPLHIKIYPYTTRTNLIQSLILFCLQFLPDIGSCCAGVICKKWFAEKFKGKHWAAFFFNEVASQGDQHLQSADQ